MNTSITIGLIKEAIGIIGNFNLPRKVVDGLATAEVYLQGQKADFMYALSKLEDAVNSISTGKFNSNLYILGVQRKEQTRYYNKLCSKISEIHRNLRHYEISSRWLARRIAIEHFRFIAMTDQVSDVDTWMCDYDNPIEY